MQVLKKLGKITVYLWATAVTYFIFSDKIHSSLRYNISNAAQCYSASSAYPTATSSVYEVQADLRSNIWWAIYEYGGMGQHGLSANGNHPAYPWAWGYSTCNKNDLMVGARIHPPTGTEDSRVIAVDIICCKMNW